MRCVEPDIAGYYRPIPDDRDFDSIIKSNEAVIAKCTPYFEKLAIDALWAYGLNQNAGKAVERFSQLLADRQSDLHILRYHRNQRSNKSLDAKGRQDIETRLRYVIARLTEPKIYVDVETIPKGYTVEQIEEIKKEWMSMPNAKETLVMRVSNISQSLGPFIRLEHQEKLAFP